MHGRKSWRQSRGWQLGPSGWRELGLAKSEMSELTRTETEHKPRRVHALGMLLNAMVFHRYRCCYISCFITSFSHAEIPKMCSMHIPQSCWGGGMLLCCPQCPQGCPGPVKLHSSLQPAWRVLIVVLRSPQCFQLICFDISSRQEVLCVGVRGSAMWHLNHAKQEHTFRFPRCFKEMWFPLCCKERVDLIATRCGDGLCCVWIRVPGSNSGWKREIKDPWLTSCNHGGQFSCWLLGVVLMLAVQLGWPMYEKPDIVQKKPSTKPNLYRVKV